MVSFVGCLVYVFSVCVFKDPRTQGESEYDLQLAYYDRTSAKYWDSVLPPEEPGDGRYAHLRLNIYGEEIDEEGNIINRQPRPRAVGFPF